MIDKNLWLDIQKHKPIIHSISNSVTANDNANLLLAVGASPIMADEPQEMKDITTISQATVLNIGTPNNTIFQSCLLAGKKANELGHPLIIDPVGVGASHYRKRKMLDLLDQIKPTIICANLGEIQTLMAQESSARGVDSTEDNLKKGQLTADRLAKKYACTVFLTGAEDYITDGTHSYLVRGGSQRMQKITGTGCMLSVLTGAITTTTDPIAASVNASFAWKVVAEAATNSKGIGQMRISLFDHVEQLPTLIEEKHQVQINEVTM